MASAEAVNQDSNIQAPRRGQGAAVTVDTTSRPYDLRSLAFNGAAFRNDLAEYLFLKILNDGANAIYLLFSPATASDMNEATVTTAGNPIAFDNAVGEPLQPNAVVFYRVRRDTDCFVQAKTATGTSTLRLFASSDVLPGRYS